MKNNKGITMITLIITIILILIIGGTMAYFSTSSLGVQKLTNMYGDIEQIQSQVDSYYIKNNRLPIYEEAGTIEFTNSGNINDGNDYYVINLSLLEDLSLNYGEEFEDVKQNEGILDFTDLYIINEQSQTIYYLKGIEFEEETYYTIPTDYAQIND